MDLPGWDRETSPYHQGEQELQNRLGRKALQERMGRKIHRPFMPEQHRTFFAQLPFLIAGSVDAHDWPWASILFGEPGFVSTPDDRTLLIDAAPVPGDPLAENIEAGAPVGFVGIELPTRRRNRVNGVIGGRKGRAIQVDVVQSYGNCPQYIQTRDMTFVREPAVPADVGIESFTELDESAAHLIRGADTLFVASYNDRDDVRDTGGVDANHRGGRPGFVKVEGNTLTIPDYVGNFAFNTLGNFLLNPKAGLLFIDFDSGDLLQLTGTVELLWDKTDEIEAFRGAERAWRFHLHHGRRLKNASPLRWTYGQESPNSRLTGDWDEAAKTLAAEAKRKVFRPFRISRAEDESSVIRSLYLEPADHDGLYDYKPGQFLTLRVTPEGGESVIRTYTLSSAPTDPHYRISVKREADGLVSRHLHDRIEVGDQIEVRAPNGSFWMDTAEERPAVLIAGGVGITPMISMIREVVSDAVRRRHLRPTTLFHVARTTDERAFASDLVAIRQATGGAVRYVSLISQPADGEEAGTDFHVRGRLTASILQSNLPLADYDFYLCGPTGFMQSVYDMLTELGVSDHRILSESFGPASLQRRQDAASPVAEAFEEAETAVVTFERSHVEQGWTPADGTLLEFAEAHGLTPSFGCRSGACGSCAVPLLAGKTGYRHQPTFQTEDGEVLLCCAVPATSEKGLRLGL